MPQLIGWLISYWWSFRKLSHLHNHLLKTDIFSWPYLPPLYFSNFYMPALGILIKACTYLPFYSIEDFTCIIRLILIPLILTIVPEPLVALYPLCPDSQSIGLVMATSSLHSPGQSGPIVKSGRSQTTPLPLKPSNTCRLRIRARRCLGHMTRYCDVTWSKSSAR